MKTILNKTQQIQWLKSNWRYESMHYTVSKAGVVKLLDSRDKLIASADGCGYDKLGTCLADFVKLALKDELTMLARGKYIKQFYGLGIFECRATLDGAFGLESMIKVINAIGFNVRHVHNVLLLSPITGSGTYAAGVIRGIK